MMSMTAMSQRSHLHIALLCCCIANLSLAQQSERQSTQSLTSQQQIDAQSLADEDARSWLERMALAMEHLSYRGNFVYSHSGELQSHAVVHVRDQRGVRERLYSLDGDAREVRRNNNLVHAVAPEQDHYSDMGYRQFTRLPSSQLLKRKRHYVFTVGKRARIASLDAQQILIQPRDGFRYGYELWLEERTGMLLKQVMLDEQQRVVEKLVFTNIELGAGIDDQDLREAGVKQVEPSENKILANVIKPPRWQPAQLPTGFELLAHEHSETDKSSLEHLLYSDGLAHISVYLEPQVVNSGDAEFPPSSYGVINIYTRSTSGINITALGAVPYGALRMIGGSIYDSNQLLQATVPNQSTANSNPSDNEQSAQ